MEEVTEKPKYTDEVGERGMRWLRSKHADWILAFVSFIESVIAPILIDPFLIALIIAKREHWLRYITISVLFSVIGGVAGYLLGALFFDFIGKWVIEFYGIEKEFAAISKSLDENAFIFVLLGAITPVPYKIVAIASGLAQINLAAFIFASLFGRIFRLGLVGGAAYLVGPSALPIIRRHLLAFAYVAGFILIAYFLYKVL